MSAILKLKRNGKQKNKSYHLRNWEKNYHLIFRKIRHGLFLDYLNFRKCLSPLIHGNILYRLVCMMLLFFAVGNAQVNLVTAIAFDRFICIARPLSSWKLSKEKVGGMIRVESVRRNICSPYGMSQK